MRDGLGDWIRRRLRKGVERQGQKAAADLIVRGISEGELRSQWQNQQNAQLSLRARKSF
jgi:hypothetical protein